MTKKSILIRNFGSPTTGRTVLAPGSPVFRRLRDEMMAENIEEYKPKKYVVFAPGTKLEDA